MQLRFYIALAVIFGTFSWPFYGSAKLTKSVSMNLTVTHVIQPLMSANDIPGMTVGILVNGQIHVFNYGLASIAPRRDVTNDTLFEIGSISKTFAATLAAYAQLNGNLVLTNMASSYMPALRGSAFDHVSLIDLGTHTPGGLPLQVPDGINNEAQLMIYFRDWKPAYAPGTTRTYSNPGIGLFGLIAAKSMNADFSMLVQNRMFPALGMHHSFIDIPADEMGNYAQGYSDDSAKIRLTMGVVGQETYGIRTTAIDLLRFLSINMGLTPINERWQRAVLATHTGYYHLQAGSMVQDLVWEQYQLPVSLAALEAGNSDKILMNPNPVVPFNPPLAPQMDALLNKTGTTNGFGAYVAFIPAQRIGILLLANKAYPIPARVAAAYEILTRLGVTGLGSKYLP